MEARSRQEFAAAPGSGLWVLEPPHRALVPWLSKNPSAPLPIDSIVLALDGSALDQLAGLAAALKQHPWAIPALLPPSPEPPMAAASELAPMLAARLALVSPPSGSAPDPRAVVASVRRRPPLTPESLAAFVCMRCGARSFRELLLAEFAAGLSAAAPGSAPATPTTSTAARAFARFGGLTAHDWRAVGRLAALVSQGAGPAGRIAAGALTTARTLRRYARKYAGLAAQRVAGLVGWESVVELALRRGGYPMPRRSAGGGEVRTMQERAELVWRKGS